MITIKLSAWKAWNPVLLRNINDCVFETDGDAENIAIGDEILRVDYSSPDILPFARACAFDVLNQTLKFTIGWRKGARIVHDLENSRISVFAEDGTYFQITEHDVLLPTARGPDKTRGRRAVPMAPPDDGGIAPRIG